MWNKVSCLRKQRDGRARPGSNHRPLDRKSNALTARPLRLLIGEIILILLCPSVMRLYPGL